MVAETLGGTKGVVRGQTHRQLANWHDSKAPPSERLHAPWAPRILAERLWVLRPCL